MTKKAFLVAGLGYGDEGKGSIVDYLVREHRAHTVIRYNGGPQAGHNVVASDGKDHIFAQFGSGSLVPGVETYLSQYMLINPANMVREAEHLQELGIRDIFQRTYIDRQAVVVTPFQIAANRLRELDRGESRHGSCGMGIGETVQDQLAYPDAIVRAGDLGNRSVLIKKLNFIRDLKLESLKEIIERVSKTDEAMREIGVLTSHREINDLLDVYFLFAQYLMQVVDEEYLKRLMARRGTIVFEGAQGVLLDAVHGFTPYHTWTDTTFTNAQALLEAGGFTGHVERVGVLRSYMTRHGAGPFVTEDAELTALLPDSTNGHNMWQGSFRAGHFDLIMAQYALKVIGGIDTLAMTHLDRLFTIPDIKICDGYEPTPYHYPAGDLDLNYMTAEKLFKARPMLQTIGTISNFKDARSYAKAIAENLDTELKSGILSFGPTAKAKGEVKF